MQTIAYRKTYVSLVVLITPNGVKQPLKIRWTDGQTYAIDKIIDVCSAPGGKSLHAAQLLRKTGYVSARDLTLNILFYS